MFVGSVLDVTMWNSGPHGFSEILVRLHVGGEQQRIGLRRHHSRHTVDGHHARRGDADRAVLPDPPGPRDRRLARPETHDAGHAWHLPDPHPVVRRVGDRAIVIVGGLTFFPRWRSARSSSSCPSRSMEMQTQVLTPPSPRPERARKKPLFEAAIVRQAVIDSFRKLSPRVQARNPVMFVVLIGSVLTTISSSRPRRLDVGGEPLRRTRCRVVVVHRAVRQLRRGDGRRPWQGAGGDVAQDPCGDDGESAPRRRRMDWCRRPSCASTTSSSYWREMIPSTVRSSRASCSVDESAITGESAPVIREAGGDRSASPVAPGCSPIRSSCDDGAAR